MFKVDIRVEIEIGKKGAPDRSIKSFKKADFKKDIRDT